MDVPRKPHFSDAQIELLERAYCNGLISTSEKFLAQYLALSEKTGLTMPQLKVWINNRKRRDRKRPHGSKDDDQHPHPLDDERDGGSSHPSQEILGRPRGTRKISGHNVFCSSLWSGEMANWSVSHRTKETHARWNNLEQKEKEKWNRQAELINATEVKDLSDRSKKKMVESSIKRLTNELDLLSQLGWSGYYMLISQGENEIKYLASPDSTKFLVDNEDICERFLKFHAIDRENCFTRSHVRKMLNDKYYEKFGIQAVEYSKYNVKFLVEGWPAGLTFKQPFDYGKNQIQRIMESKNDIQFVQKEGSEHDHEVHDEIRQAEREASEEPVSTEVPEEEETEVEINSNSTTDFSKPRAVRAKARSFVKKGDIVPCIAAQEGYWLFQCSSKVKTNGKIKGKWLDNVGERNYVLLNYATEIDERTVFLKDNKRMVVPTSYFDHLDHKSFTISIAGDSMLRELLRSQNM
eukprot:Seg2045.3 transcript_id=Seg2045.3/GoldUCD/mRNA.D3Y31 product="hypothetical protein" protein_id=Seg2045.3/GoldUCD/D3Y31